MRSYLTVRAFAVETQEAHYRWFKTRKLYKPKTVLMIKIFRLSRVYCRRLLLCMRSTLRPLYRTLSRGLDFTLSMMVHPPARKIIVISRLVVGILSSLEVWPRHGLFLAIVVH